MAFRGHFDYSLDAKNRLNVPPKFRPAFADGLVLAKGLEPCIWIWQPAAYEDYTAQVTADFNPASTPHRKLMRFLAGNSYETELDAAGRVTVPPKLIDHAGLGREVSVVGVGGYLEVWDRERWLGSQDELSAEVAEITESIGHPA